MTPLSCSLIARALVGPALVNDPLSCSFLVRAFVGPALVHDPAFLLSAGTTILVVVTAHETKRAWYCSLGSSRLVHYLSVVSAYLEDAVLSYFSVVTRCTRPLRMAMGLFMCSRVCCSCFRILAFNTSGPTPALQSLKLPTFH